MDEPIKLESATANRYRVLFGGEAIVVWKDP